MKSLADRINAEAREAVTDAQRKAETTRVIAEAYDAQISKHGYSGPEPSHVTTYKHDGAIGSVSFKDVAPDELLAMLRTFPPTLSVFWRDGSTVSHGNADTFKPRNDGVQQTAADGLTLRFGGGIGYGQHSHAEWDCDLPGGVRVTMRADLRQLHGILPSISARYKYHGSEPVAVESCELSMPIKQDSVTVQKYGRGSQTAFNDFLLWSAQGSEGTLKLVQAWTAECERREHDSQAAYIKDLAKLAVGTLEPEPLQEKAPYAERKLRSGTERQTALLESTEARAEQTLARKHWACFRKDERFFPADSPHKPRDDYFDHYSWACAYLHRHGAYTDTHDGKPYKYGSAWL